MFAVEFDSDISMNLLSPGSGRSVEMKPSPESGRKLFNMAISEDKKKFDASAPSLSPAIPKLNLVSPSLEPARQVLSQVHSPPCPRRQSLSSHSPGPLTTLFARYGNENAAPTSPIRSPSKPKHSAEKSSARKFKHSATKSPSRPPMAALSQTRFRAAANNLLVSSAIRCDKHHTGRLHSAEKARAVCRPWKREFHHHLLCACSELRSGPSFAIRYYSINVTRYSVTLTSATAFSFFSCLLFAFRQKGRFYQTETDGRRPYYKL